MLEHVDTHLEEPLTVEALSSVAAFSKYHFHRQFAELFGMNVFKYVQLVRMRRASLQLAFRDHERIIDIALASGYESHEAFSRAFKKAIGQTPSEFRQQPQWELWHATYQRLSEVRAMHMKPDFSADDVKIVEFPETRVAVLEHRGHPNLLGDSIRKFIEWRKQNNAGPKVSATFNLLYNDPVHTPPEEFRLDLCAQIQRDVGENSFGVFERTIPGGRCAVLRHVGSDDNLAEAFTYLYSKWLPASGEELRDFPLYLQRLRFFPDVPEQEAVLDIFLPLK